MEENSSQETPEIPEGVDISTISDETIEFLGLDRTRIEQLRETNLRKTFQKKGETFYETSRHSLPPGDSTLKTEFTLEIDNRLQFQIPSGTTLYGLPEIITANFKQRTHTPETAAEVQRVHSWCSGYMEAAFQEKDWRTVFSTADSIDEGLEILPRIKQVVGTDFTESLRIAQAFEDYRREKAQATAESAPRPVPPRTQTL